LSADVSNAGLTELRRARRQLNSHRTPFIITALRIYMNKSFLLATLIAAAALAACGKTEQAAAPAAAKAASAVGAAATQGASAVAGAADTAASAAAGAAATAATAATDAAAKAAAAAASK
jgi:hypothetical protein